MRRHARPLAPSEKADTLRIGPNTQGNGRGWCNGHPDVRRTGRCASSVGVCEVGYFSKRHDTHRRVVRVTDPSSAKDDGRDSGPRTMQRERSSSACEPTLGAVEGFTNILYLMGTVLVLYLVPTSTERGWCRGRPVSNQTKPNRTGSGVL